MSVIPRSIWSLLKLVDPSGSLLFPVTSHWFAITVENHPCDISQISKKKKRARWLPCTQLTSIRHSYLKKTNLIFVHRLYSLQNPQWLPSHALLFKLFKSRLHSLSWHSLSRKLNLGLPHALSKGCSIPLLWCPSWPIFLAMFVEFIWIIYVAW